MRVNRIGPVVAVAVKIALRVALGAALGIAPIAAGDGPCLLHRIAVDEPCVGAECWYTDVGATDADGVRHVVWRQNDAAPRIRTARIEHDGTVVVGELVFDAPPSSIFGLAVRGDLLAVGVETRIELFRLVDQAWIHEATLSDETQSLVGRRIAIDIAGPVERVVVSGANIVVAPGGGPQSSPIWIFRNDREWTLEQVVPIPPPLSGQRPFGADIAIDGTTLAVGRPWLATFQSVGAEEVHIYELVDGVWTSTQVVAGPWWTPPGAGHRLALVGDTLVTTVATGNPWDFFGGTNTIDLQIHRRGDAGFEPSDYVFGTTATRRGWELDAHESEGDVLLYGSVHRAAPVVIGAFRLRVRDGVVIEELVLPTPPSALEGLVAPIWGVAAVGGAEPWVAVTAPEDPAGSSVSIIGLEVPRSICPSPPLGDLDGNGLVDGADLGLLLAQWGYCIGCPADLDGDGVVDGADLGTLLENWSIDRTVHP